MAEATRVRPIEYYNPRPLILSVCFIWGIAVGFGVNFFRSPQVAEEIPASKGGHVAEAVRPVPSEIERRRMDLPNVAEVEPAPVVSPSIKQTLENFDVEPPQAILTVEGGLTGQTAQPIRQAPAAASPSAPAAPTVTPSGPSAPPPPPPPIPDLMPW